MFFDDGLAGAEGYDEHVQGLDIHQLGLVNGISGPELGINVRCLLVRTKI